MLPCPVPYSCSCLACSPTLHPQRPATAAAPAPPAPGAPFVPPATGRKGKPRDGTQAPPIALCPVRKFFQKIIQSVFVPGKSRRKTPPCLLSPPKFYKQKSGWVAGGVGLGPWRHRGGWGCFWRIPGRVKVTHAYNLGAPSATRGGAVVHLEAVDLSFGRGMSWGASLVAGAPEG
jgi:hypothetical protein